MIPLRNQPFDFGYSDTCECGANDFEQFFLKSDEIQVAFEIVPCDEPFSTGANEFDTFAGALSFNGSVVTFTGTGILQILLPSGIQAGRYLIQFNVQSYTSGTLEIIIDGNTQATITPQVGLNSVWVDFQDNEPFISFQGNSLNAVIDFQITYQFYQSNQELYLVDSGGNEITDFNKFYRNNYVVFGGVPFNLLSLTDCLYRLRWLTDECNPYSGFSYSNYFKIVDSQDSECTVALSGCYPDYQFGWPKDFEPLVRLQGRLAQPQYTGEIVISRDSAGYSTVNYLDRVKTMQLKLNLIPEYILDFISVWIGFENMYINGQSYRVTDNSFPEVIYTDATDLGQLDFTVQRVRQLVQRVNCFPALSPCEEVPPPPNMGIGKLFEDDEQFIFQDDNQFNFE
jgi:hypothetical protein